MNLDYAVKEPNSLWITYNQQKTECYEHEQEKCLIKFSDLKICMSGFLLVTELPMNVYGRPRWTKKKTKNMNSGASPYDRPRRPPTVRV